MSSTVANTMMKISSLLNVVTALLSLFAAASSPAQQYAQQLALTGLHSVQSQGQFHAVAADLQGNIYLLLDQKDGVRVLKSDASGNLLAQIQFGAPGDSGLAMATDPQGNLYITGTTSSGTLSGTPGSAFLAAADASTNSFLAKLNSSLSLQFLTFLGSGRMSAVSVSATSDAVFVTGSIFAPTLPVSGSAIIRSPASGSLQNGFVEKFNLSGTTLLYATYLSGATGDTSPASIITDAYDDAYVAGYTTASGFPTSNALVPEKLGSTSGFLTKLTPGGDGLLFSTFLPGGGISSLAYDAAAEQILASGNVSPGQFPVATVPAPLVSTPYQVLLRLSPDGSSLISSVLVAPGNSSQVVSTPQSSAWIAGSLTGPLLPVRSLSTVGNSFAARVTSQNIIDQAARFGGLASRNAAYASLPVTLNSVASTSSNALLVAGAVSPTVSASLLSTTTFDLPLFDAPTTALPSELRDAIPVTLPCSGSLCQGQAGYLAEILPDKAAPSLSFSIEDAPNLILRNLGSTSAGGLQLSSTGFTQTSDCPGTLAPGSECTVQLSGPGPGSITVTASNAPSQSAKIPVLASPASPGNVVVSPRELDFGIQTSDSPPAQQVLTITNLTQQVLTFPSHLDAGAAGGQGFSELSSDCPLAPDGSSKTLPGGASCRITLAFNASSTSTNDGFLETNWLIGTIDVLLTGYSQAAALNLSSSEIDFGTQYIGGLRLPRYLYLSNSSSLPTTHTPLTTPAGSPFLVTDSCPVTLSSHSVCQIRFDYVAAQQTSTDSLTLTLEAGLQVFVTGKTLPEPSAVGSSVNANLTVTPLTVSFPDTVVVTSTSTSVQIVTIANSGAAAFPLALSVAGDFTQSTNCGAVLSSGSNCVVQITFAPSQPGIRQGLLTVTTGTNNSPVYVSLSGTAQALFSSNNGTLSFGSVLLGQPEVLWSKITQSFPQLTVASSATDFSAMLVEDTGYGHGQPPASSFSSVASGSCTNCWLGVQFKPSSLGAVTASLNLTSSSSGNPDTITVTGTGLPLTGLILTPASQDFGSVAVHSTSPAHLFTLTNLVTPTASINVSALQASGDFALLPNNTGGPSCSGLLAPSASCYLQVAFAPSAIGSRDGILTISTDAGPSTAALSGTGTPDPGLSLNPNALIFTNVPGPDATQQTITVTNTGSETLQIGQPSASNDAFTASGTCTSLAPSSSCTITIVFAPTTAPVVASLQFITVATSNGAAVSTGYSLGLSGTYTAQERGLELLPGAVTFAPTSTGKLGSSRQFNLINLTPDALVVNVSLPRQFALSSPPCGGLAPNASCTFQASFVPLTNGDVTGTVFATATPQSGNYTLNAISYLEGYGNGTGTLSVTGNFFPGGPLSFGQVASGQSISQTVTLTNAGTSPPSPTITIRRITSQWPFLSTSTCNSPLTPQQSCTVTITYSPQSEVVSGTSSPAPSTQSGTLLIESDADSSPYLLNLTGSVVPAVVTSPSNTPPIFSFVTAPSSLTFDQTIVGNSSPSQTIILSNTGTAQLHIFNAISTPDFAVLNNCGLLLPNSQCALTVSFTPKFSGTRIGAVQISSDSTTPLEFVSLLGTANPSSLQLSVSSLDFGAVLVGASTTLSLQVTNTSSSPVIFNSISASSGYSVDGSCPSPGSSLSPQTSCTLQVTFSPSLPGPSQGLLSITSSAGSLPLTVALTGSGSNSHLQISPASLDFGSIAVGYSSRLPIILSNTGSAPLTGLGLTAAGDFAVTSPCPSSTLAPGGSCTAFLTFTPSTLGQRTGSLLVSNADGNPFATVPLAGVGVQNTSFLLTVDGGPTSSATTPSGQPATYNLTLLPQNGFSGTVALTCTAVQLAPHAYCALVPSTLTLSGASQNSVATINTVSAIHLTQNNQAPFERHNSLWLCLIFSPILLFSKRLNLPRPLLALFITLALLSAGGCGSGGDPTLRYTPPGSFQYQVTASSTSGIQINQTVTLNLVVTPR